MPWNRLGTIINVALQHFYTNTIINCISHITQNLLNVIATHQIITADTMVSYDTIIIFLPILSTLILTVINILYFHDGKIKNKSERTFEKKYVRICLVWCTIGDSNPGPTD